VKYRISIDPCCTGGELVTLSSAVLRVATSSEAVRELFCPPGRCLPGKLCSCCCHVSHRTLAVYGRQLAVLPVAEDSADTWLLVLQLLMRPSTALLNWVRAWHFPVVYL
jgi:hypothetical protein